MAPFLDVHLEEVPEIVERGGARAEPALLLDRGGLGVSLRDDQAAKGIAVLAGHLLPHRLPVVVAKADATIGDRLGEEDAPAVLRHAHVVEMRPAARIDRDGGAEIDGAVLEPMRPHLSPPVEELRLPLLEGALQALVGG